MLVKNGSIGTVSSLLSAGYTNTSGGAIWTGTGIRSSVAAANTNLYTSLGAIQNSIFYNGSNHTLYSAFDGTASTVQDVLIKYTWNGDANLDGKVDGSDYSLIDNGYLDHLTGWYNGAFNYDGEVSEADYTLIDDGLAGYNASGMQSLAITSGTPPILAVLEQLWHWKLPGYAAYYLPIYEADFGELSTSAYDQALADGTPADGTAPAYFPPDPSLFSGSSGTPLVSIASVPEPASFVVILTAASFGNLCKRRPKQPKRTDRSSF